MGLLKFIFLLILLFVPLGQLARLQMGNGLVFLLNDILVGILFLTWLIYSIVKKKIPTKRLLKPIGIFSLIALISLLINLKYLNQQEFLVSFLYLLRWISYICLYFITGSFDLTFKKIVVFLMTIVGGVVVAEGYIQYLFYPSLRNLYYLGWDEHIYRMFSIFLDPNFAGAFFVLYLIFLLGLLYKYGKLKNNRIIFISVSLLFIFTVFAILLTYSRSALIMLFFSLVTFFVINKQKKFIIGVILLLIIFFLVSSRNFSIENVNLLRITSSEARISTAVEAIGIIEKYPILGVGFNTYRYTLIRLGLRGSTGALTSHADAGTDNSFLFVLATTGIIGFIAYLGVWVFFLKEKNIKQDFGWLLPVVMSSICGLFIDSLFINSLFYPFIMMWMFIVLGLRENM